jgi:hypothetical protein
LRTVPVTLVIASAMMLAVPVGAANWSAMGSIEPDNMHEMGTEIGKYNYADAPGSATNRIYFQAFEMTFVENLNVGVPNTADTHNENPTLISPGALLGVWRDCNGDGYIGLAESALLEYPSELLQSTTICPPKSGTNGQYVGQGYPSNYNGWVSELIPIGGDGGDAGDDLRDRRIIRDPDAKVWGDFDLPDHEPAVAGEGTCAITPLPRGTLQSTGGALTYTHCHTGVLNVWNDILAGTLVDGVPGADPGNSLGLIYENPSDAEQDGHPLHQPTLGSAESDRHAVSVHDCGTPLVRGGDIVNDSGIEVLLRDVGVIGQNEDLGGDVHNAAVHSPNPTTNGGDPSQWTVPGQYNETTEENDDCDPENDDSEDFYGFLGEGDFTGSDGAGLGKRQAEWNLGFNDANRGDAPYSVIPTKGGSIPNAFGAGRVAPAAQPTYAGWSDNVVTVKAPALIRANLTAQTVKGGEPWILTFYAFVGNTPTSLGFTTPGNSRTYGVDQCGSFTSGVHGGWNCDPAKWYFNDDGSPMNEPTNSGGFARPGQPYQLRDIDCYDGGTSAGVGTGTPSILGPDRCL